MADLDAWEQYGVHGHTDADRPWVPYHEALREPAARLVGALPREVVMMNSLTVNLHLLLASFYRPDGHPPSHRDRGLGLPLGLLRRAQPCRVPRPRPRHGRAPPASARPARTTLRTEDVIDTLNDHAHSIATVMLGGVNYLTGELMDMPPITEAGHAIGATVGWDLAHAAGNVPLPLHDWDVDFAAWCSYKYLNSGPGAVAGAFVHERHLANPALPRLEGWWSTDPATRFEMRPISVPQAVGRRVEHVEPADPRHGSGAHVPGDLRHRRNDGPSGAQPAPDGATCAGSSSPWPTRCRLTIVTPDDDARPRRAALRPGATPTSPTSPSA